MKDTIKKINFSEKRTANCVWQSIIARYLVCNIPELMEDILYINNLRANAVGADHFGSKLRDYIRNCIEYCNTLHDEEQIQELAKTYILITVYKNTPTGMYCDVLNEMMSSISEEGIIRVNFMYILKKVHFVDLDKSNILAFYENFPGDDTFTVAMSRSLVQVAWQFTDILGQCNAEIEKMKALSHTDCEFGMAFLNNLKNRIEYIKLIEPTMALYQIFCLEQFINTIETYHFGNSKKEIAKQRKKLFMLKSSLKSQLASN